MLKRARKFAIGGPIHYLARCLPFIALARRPPIKPNRAAARSPLVVALGPAQCPACGETLLFRTDRDGRMIEYCACGHHAFVARRSGKREGPEEPAGGE